MDVAPQVVVRDVVAHDPLDHRERDEPGFALDQDDVVARHQAVGALVLGPHLLFGRDPRGAVVDIGQAHQLGHRAVVREVAEGTERQAEIGEVGLHGRIGRERGAGDRHHGDSGWAEATVASGRGLRQSIELVVISKPWLR